MLRRWYVGAVMLGLMLAFGASAQAQILSCVQGRFWNGRIGRSCQICTVRICTLTMPDGTVVELDPETICAECYMEV